MIKFGWVTIGLIIPFVGSSLVNVVVDIIYKSLGTCTWVHIVQCCANGLNVRKAVSHGAQCCLKTIVQISMKNQWVHAAAALRTNQELFL